MKKYTNKILCIAAIFIAVVLIISSTVDFQKEYRQHPDAFKKTTPTETVIISDNLTTAMTGGQDSAGTNKFEQICLGLGVEPEHVKVVVPLPKNMEDIKQTIRDEINYNGVSVIIPRRECIQTFRRHAKEKKQ